MADTLRIVARTKAYSREYARRVRERRLSEKLRTAQRCPHRLGPGVCNGHLRTTTDSIGRSVTICDLCDRRKAGVCRDCSRPVYGAIRKAIRCEAHAELAKQRQIRESADRHIEARRVRSREAMRARSPEDRARRNALKAIWRKANPDKVRAYKRRYTMKHGSEKGSRYVEYHRRYNAQSHRARKKREQAVAAYYRDNPVRPDPHCVECLQPIQWQPLPGGSSGRPPLRCDGCCSLSELARRIECRTRAAERAAQPATVVKKLIRPIRVKHPMPARYAPSGERLCLTPHCQIVVTHRKKKCTKCREREVESARKTLAAIGGRGRRTDLRSVKAA